MKTRTKRRIVETFGWLCALAVIFVVGGMERELISVGKGAALSLGCELVGAALLWKAGVVRVR